MKIFGLIAVVVAVWLCALGGWGIHRVSVSLEEVEAAARGLRSQGDADMMHDAIRGDVLARALAGSQGAPAKVRELQESFEEHATQFNKRMAELEQLPLDDKLRGLIASIKPRVAAYIDAGRAAMQMDGSERDRARLDAALEAWHALEGPMGQLGDQIQASAAAIQDRAAGSVNLANWGLAIGFLLAVLGSIYVTQRLSRTITKPLQEVVTLARAVAEGDLTYSLPPAGRNEIGDVVRAVGEMQARLSETLRSVRAGADALDATSDELLAGSRQVAQASSVQSEAAMQMAAGVEELTASIQEVSEGSNDAHNVSYAASEQCARSEALVRKVMQDMSALQASVKSSSDVIHSLGEQSKSIRAIVQVIKDIADQTNLLALNAAIEAARAGEQGRGFAVVADEVRKLADRTGQSTQQIAQMIDAIQRSVSAAVEGMVSGVQLVDSGTSCAQEAADAMGEVNLGVLRILGVVDTAVHAMGEQAAAANESASKVAEVAASAEKNAHVARDSVASAEQLHYLAASIKEIVSRFKTP